MGGDSNYVEVGVTWAVSAKNALKNSRFLPNQSVFGKNPYFLSACTDLLLALDDRKASEIVAENLNTLHSTRKKLSKNKNFLKHHT